MRDISKARRARFDAGARKAMRGAASAMQLALVVLVLAVIAAAAWWFFGRGGTSPLAPVSAPVATEPAAPGQAAVPPPSDDLSVNDLYKAARTAMTEKRMVAPSGNNAMELYLRILAKQPDDSDATDTLRELFPFATGTAEDQINQGNFDEATRIMGLLAKADPSNYTLTILRSKLDAKKKQSDREQQLQAQQQAAAAAAKGQPVPAPGTAAPGATAAGTTPAATDAAAAAAAATTSAPASATPTAATPRPAEVARATPPPTAAPAPEPAGETRDVRITTPPQPAYPPAAARNRQEGWVEVEFTVSAEGSVQNARVVNANPQRVFDREAVRAIEQAKFEPRLDKGQAVATTMRRRIEFKLGN